MVLLPVSVQSSLTTAENSVLTRSGYMDEQGIISCSRAFFRVNEEFSLFSRLARRFDAYPILNEESESRAPKSALSGAVTLSRVVTIPRQVSEFEKCPIMIGL